MPELPEVETTARMLNRALPGLKIIEVWTSYGGVIHRGKNQIKNKKYFADFKKLVVGQKITVVRRRGKNVLINLTGGKVILVHMKMTGHLLFGRYRRAGSPETKTPNRKPIGGRKFQIPAGWNKEEWRPAESFRSPLWDPYNRFIRLVFILSNRRHLVLSDVRKFAKVCLLANRKENELVKLGPEPLAKNFDFKKFLEQVLKKPNRLIKPVLMNQETIAGLGNIYSDEVLWRAGVRPESPVKKIPHRRLREIFRAIKVTLKNGLKFGGDSTSDYRRPDGRAGAFQNRHQAYQQTGRRCSRPGCAGRISRIKIGGRSGHFCPQHQKLFR